MTYHAVVLYAHDAEAVDAFFRNGFGMRCIDAVRPMEPIGGARAEAHCQELDKAGMEAVEPLMRGLSEHQGRSPCFMRATEEEIQARFQEARERESRVFVATVDGAVVAYVEMQPGGENFAAEADGTMNICGAYCLPEHRGGGIARSLVDHAIGVLRGEGYVRLGVDYESFNPTAYAFWGKHFEAYTVSVVRRIDEGALRGV
jgi:GNAT superfamily N-acetyltransferase